MKQLPSVSSYGNYNNPNYGLNTILLDLGTIRLYYSYKTIVAYYDHEDGLVCSENAWTTTTGKHLHWIQADKNKRVSNDMFNTMLQSALERHVK